MDTDGVTFHRSLPRKWLGTSPFAGTQRPAAFPRVDILYCYLGCDEVFVEAALRADAKGIVVAGFAPGIAPPSMMDRLESIAAQGMPIVMATRAFSGRVSTSDRFRKTGIVAAEDFSPQKARILLTLAIQHGYDGDRLRALFAAV